MAAPERLFICAKNVVDLEGTAITASPALVSTLGASHLKLSSRSRVARSVGNPATQEYKFTWNGDGQYLNFLTWYRHNAEPGVQWRVIVYPNADWTGVALYDSGLVDMYPAYLLGDYGAEFGFLPLGYSQAVFFAQPRFSTLFFGSTVPGLSVKVTVTNTVPGVSDGYLDVSRAFMGKGIELLINPASWSVAWKDNGKLSAASGGGPRVDADSLYRVMGFDVPWIDATQRAELLDIQRYAGTTKDVFASGFPAETNEGKRDYELIGKLIEAKEIELPRGNPYGVHATAFKLREI